MQVPSLQVLLEYSCTGMEKNLNEIVKLSPATFHHNGIWNRKPSPSAEMLLLYAIPSCTRSSAKHHIRINQVWRCVTNVWSPVPAT